MGSRILLTVRLLLSASAALVGFAANSLLTRAALGGGHLDAGGFTLARVVTGALALALIVRARRDGRDRPDRASWTPALALTGYLAAFTLAYTRIGAAIGALLLFGAVQVTMMATGLIRGERPGTLGWIGGALAVAGLMTLTFPGLAAPDPAGAILMIAAGACWGAYSILGRGSRDPLADTSSNFVRSTALLALPMAWLAWPPRGTLTGLALATASGALASGLGYTLWYSILPSLSAWRAAILQLLVPIITALGAALFLSESISSRLVVSTALVAVGVTLTAARGRPSRARQ